MEAVSLTLSQSTLSKSNLENYKIFRCPQCNLIPFIFLYDNDNEKNYKDDIKLYLLCPNQHENKINLKDIYSYNQININDSICCCCEKKIITMKKLNFIIVLNVINFFVKIVKIYIH